ncbi:MAG: serine/threonine-protein kinase [bacterium]
MSFEMGDTILGRYVIVERLGSGAMGVVYRAQDATLERDVALKVLLPHIGQDPELLQRFRREARVLAKIRNPSIIVVHDLVTLDDQRLVLVLEFVAGGSLDGYISANGPLDWRHTAQIGVAAAEALAEAHEAGVVHRDIKPSNILMEPDGGIRVADFGIARISGESSMTMQGESIGTPAFMSPEQALGQETGPASDIYSLGAVLYAATTGQVPFVTEEGGFAAALAHVNRPVPDPRDIRPDVPRPGGRDHHARDAEGPRRQVPQCPRHGAGPA